MALESTVEPLERTFVQRHWRWGVTLVGLALTAFAVDGGAAWDALAGAQLGWVAVAVSLTVPTTCLMAARWVHAAGKLGFTLRWSDAVGEYYATMLLNQVFPTGVAGEFARVLRRREGPPPPAGTVLQSVVLERTSGQLALLSFLAISAVSWGLTDGGSALLVAAAVSCVALGIGWGLSRPRRWRGAAVLRSWWSAVRSTLWGPSLAVQLWLSSLVLVSIIAIFVACARAVGVHLTPLEAMTLVPWMLAATTVQVSVGGWGIREASVAALFHGAGLDGAQGVAASVLFGVVCLVGALPGLAWMLTPRGSRTARHCRGGSAGSVGESLRRDSPRRAG